jgi:thymidylate synthase (FAD)
MTTIFSNRNILTPQESCLLLYLKKVEEQYMLFVENDFKPQEARAILPLCTKSELVVTGFVSDWKHFFDLRTNIAKTGKPHPDLLQVTNPLYEEFIKLKLI